MGLFGSLLPPDMVPINRFDPAGREIESPREIVLVKGDMCGMSAA
jgi:hypothetical protein